MCSSFAKQPVGRAGISRAHRTLTTYPPGHGVARRSDTRLCKERAAPGVRLLPELSVLLFFFQAEDGIRDAVVTGVQTCALPISTVRGDQPVPVPVGRRRHVDD